MLGLLAWFWRLGRRILGKEVFLQRQGGQDFWVFAYFQEFFWLGDALWITIKLYEQLNTFSRTFFFSFLFHFDF